MFFPVYNVSPFAPNNAPSAPWSWASPTRSSDFLNAFDQSRISDTEVTLSSLGQVQAASDAFQSALALLMPPSLNGISTSGSSNPSVATAAAQSNAPTGTYDLTVNSLAQVQALQSTGYATPDTTVIGSGNLTITRGTFNAGSNTFTPGAQAPSTVALSNATPDDVATAINTAGGGVSAVVQAVTGGFALLLSGTGTGASNAFEVQVDNPSLSGLSFDPTNPASSGLTETQAAQDASLTVNGATVSSGNNGGVAIAPGLSVDLFQAGSSVVTSVPSSTALQSQAQSLASAFNTVQSGLAASASNGPAVEVAGPYANALTQAAIAAYSNGSSLLSLPSQIGLNLQFGVSLGNTGSTAPSVSSLSLDTGTLNASAANDATGARGLLSAIVQAFNTIADSYGGGGGVLPSTQDAYQSALYIDRLVAAQPLQSALPTVNQLAADQSSQDALAPIQIQSEQQYARAIAPLQLSAWTSALLTELYTPYALPAGLLSVLA
jgi:flagellar hook-associated protein 2